MKFFSKRLLVELLITGVLFIITIFIVFLAQGKIISPDGTIKETGVIEVHSIPDNVRAFINGAEIGLSGNRIQNILTGKVKLKLQKEGYTPWEKLVEVNNDKITYVYAQLYPLNLKREQVVSPNIDTLVYSEDKNKLIFTVLDSEVLDEIGIWKLELNPNVPSLQSVQPTKIFALSEDLRNTLRTFPYTLSLSPDDSFILLDVPYLKTITKINLNALNESVNLIELIGFYPDLTRWLGDSDTLLIRDGNLLYEQKLTSMEKNIIYFHPDIAPIFSVGNSGIMLLDSISPRLVYYTKGSTNTIKIPITITEPRIIADTSVDATNIVLSEIQSLHLAPQNQNIFVIFVNNQALYVNLESNIVRAVSNVTKLNAISSDGQSFMFESEGNIYSFLFDKISKKSSSNLLSAAGASEALMYTNAGKQLLEVTKKDNLFTVKVSDIDGSNKIVLASDLELLGESTVFMHREATELYLVINSSGIMENKNFNLYKIELKL